MFVDAIIICIKDPQDSIRKLLKLINAFSKVAEYNLNTEKSVTFLYTNKCTEKESRKTIPFTIASKIILEQI